MTSPNFESNNFFDNIEENDTSFEDEVVLKKITKKKNDPVKNKIEQEKVMKFEKAIANILTLILKTNNPKKNPSQKNNNAFYSERIPKISLYDYIKRIHKYTFVEINTMILSLIYIDRICVVKDFDLNYYNIHKILFTAILVAIKYNEDDIFNNKHYSQVSGVSIKELNLMERQMLVLLEFKLYVDDNDFEKYKKYLETFCENEFN